MTNIPSGESIPGITCNKYRERYVKSALTLKWAFLKPHNRFFVNNIIKMLPTFFEQRKYSGTSFEATRGLAYGLILESTFESDNASLAAFEGKSGGSYSASQSGKGPVQITDTNGTASQQHFNKAVKVMGMVNFPDKTMNTSRIHTKINQSYPVYTYCLWGWCWNKVRVANEPYPTYGYHYCINDAVKRSSPLTPKNTGKASVLAINAFKWVNYNANNPYAKLLLPGCRYSYPIVSLLRFSFIAALNSNNHKLSHDDEWYSLLYDIVQDEDLNEYIPPIDPMDIPALVSILNKHILSTRSGAYKPQGLSTSAFEDYYDVNKPADKTAEWVNQPRPALHPNADVKSDLVSSAPDVPGIIIDENTKSVPSEMITPVSQTLSDMQNVDLSSTLEQSTSSTDSTGDKMPVLTQDAQKAQDAASAKKILVKLGSTKF